MLNRPFHLRRRNLEVHRGEREFEKLHLFQAKRLFLSSRTSKTANKLKVLPSTATPIDPIEEEDDDDADEETVERPKRSAKAAAVENESGGVEVSPMRPFDDAEIDGIRQFYTALSQIPAGSARRDAMRLTKTEKSKLPRVTAYCTAA
jgi:uncharacterized Rmd1/YagE family protein